MLITPPASGSRLDEELRRIGRNPEVVAWLEQNRANILEVLAQVPEEQRLRQMQGAAVAMKELLAVLTRKS